jgi:hypothetical protein
VIQPWLGLVKAFLFDVLVNTFEKPGEVSDAHTQAIS